MKNNNRSGNADGHESHSDHSEHGEEDGHSGHDDHAGHHHELPQNMGKAFLIGITPNLAFVIGEWFFGIASNSLARRILPVQFCNQENSMRFSTLAIAGAFTLLSFGAAGQVPSDRTTELTLSSLTLHDALSRAASASTALRVKQAQLAAAEGAAADARSALYNNPTVSAERTGRSVQQANGTERRKEWNAGISQAFETGGQGRFRREASVAALEALRLEIADVQRQVQSEAAALFFRILALQQRAEVETQALKLFDEAAAAVQRRRQAGEDTKLDANVALVEAERARNQLAVATEQLLLARGELAARLQLPATALPVAEGDLRPRPLPYTLDQLVASLEGQPRLLALAQRERSAAARLRLERASVSPDVTVGLNTGREGGVNARERLTTVMLSVPLPLFRRNGTGIGQATSELTQVQVEHEAALRDSRANLFNLWSRLASLEQRVRRLQDTVLPALTENLSLSTRSRQAGQIGLLELIVVNRQALDARRDLIEALSEYHATRTALELGSSWSAEGNP